MQMDEEVVVSLIFPCRPVPYAFFDRDGERQPHDFYDNYGLVTSQMFRDYKAIFFDGSGLCELLRLFASPHRIQEQATLERELELQAHGITLRVKSLSGDVANLRVSTHDTITRLKSAVETEFGMPASELSLVCGTAVLQDDHVIDELISREILDPSAILHVVSKGGQRAAGEITSVLVQQPAAARLAGLELEDGAALPARPRVAFFEPRVALHDNPVETPIEVYVEDRRA